MSTDNRTTRVIRISDRPSIIVTRVSIPFLSLYKMSRVIRFGRTKTVSIILRSQTFGMTRGNLSGPDDWRWNVDDGIEPRSDLSGTR